LRLSAILSWLLFHNITDIAIFAWLWFKALFNFYKGKIDFNFRQLQFIRQKLYQTVIDVNLKDKAFGVGI